MRIPNYDSTDDNVGNYKQLYDFMPNKCFRMLICGPSGSGNLLYFDKIYLFAKNLEQSKYQTLLNIFEPISKDVGYDIIEASNNQIIPVSELTDDNQKLVIFDDFVCAKKPKAID